MCFVFKSNVVYTTEIGYDRSLAIRTISERKDSNDELVIRTFKDIEKYDPIASSVRLEYSSTSMKHQLYTFYRYPNRGNKIKLNTEKLGQKFENWLQK